MAKDFSRILIITLKNNPQVILREIIDRNPSCYYLAEDYDCLVDLQEKFKGKMEIKSLGGVFNETLQEMKDSVLEVLSELNKKNDSYAWWGGQIASKSVSATSIFLNIIYFFCAKKLLLEKSGDIIFIVDSPALSECLANFSKQQGYQVSNYGNRFSGWGKDIKFYLRYVAQAGSFFLRSWQGCGFALHVSKSTLEKRTRAKKRIVIRSWITQGTFDRSGEFKDRNFGRLPQWLRSKGYEVWVLPMFFNLSAKEMKKVYMDMKNSVQTFLIPEHYLKFSDYVRSLYNGYKVLSKRIGRLEIDGLDVSSFVNEDIRRRGLDVPLCVLNLSCHLLKRLKEEGFVIDSFYYALECNAPENQFVLSCRKYFPNANVIGFQHTTFFPNQLAYHLGSKERECRPLPDKIICSGPVYRDLYKKAGFPQTLLADGPNLRFQSVHSYCGKVPGAGGRNGGKKILLLPLTFSHSLAFDLFIKVKDAIGANKSYRVCIRTHPLLSKKVLSEFLKKMNMDEYMFADEGTMQDWLSKAYAVISTGGSVTILEAASFGIPVIRVIPDNTIYYDPFSATSYPLRPVNTSFEVRQQLELIEKLQEDGKMPFNDMAKDILHNYFADSNEENLQVFL